MDKRLFLALLLTALVVVLTPVVFPTPQPVRSTIPDTTIAPSSRAPAGMGAGTGPQSPPAAGDRAGAPSMSAPRRAADTARAAAPVAAETTEVRGGGSEYRFITPGAAPVSVVLGDYRSLRPGRGTNPVDLVRPGDQLLR